MPRLTKSVPKYRKHRASGQAVVTLNGQDIYLGPHGTKASRIEYDRVVSEWLVGGRQLAISARNDSTLTIVELCAAYVRWAKVYYSDSPGSMDRVRAVVRILKQAYGRTDAADFGPRAFQALQQQLVDQGHARTYINHLGSAIRRIFKWGASQEIIPAAIHQALTTVSGVRRGRSGAVEAAPVKPIPEADVQATLPYMSSVVADMVCFQRVTGCRPGEVCILRPCDVDRSGDVWVYCPKSHKTEHHGHDRAIHIGPKSQGILTRYLLREADGYCFSPAEALRQRHIEQRARRKSKVQPSQVDRSKAKPQHHAGDRYTTGSYRRAIHRACDRAGIDRWSPNRLRHSAGTEIRKRFGLEAAQVTLGHATADITQVYAERDAELVREVARKIG